MIMVVVVMGLKKATGMGDKHESSELNNNIRAHFIYTLYNIHAHTTILLCIMQTFSNFIYSNCVYMHTVKFFSFKRLYDGSGANNNIFVSFGAALNCSDLSKGLFYDFSATLEN